MTTSPAARRLRRPRLRALAVAVAALAIGPATLTAPVVGSLAAASATTAPSSQHTGDVGDTLRVVHANIRNGMEPYKAAADFRTVAAQTPDVYTFNEVAGRGDASLTLPGYEMFRVPGTYTGANVVGWRADRWTKIHSGVAVISEAVGICCGQKHDPGIRRATWVTLRSIAGRQISVVSTHFAQRASNTEGLLAVSVQNLGELTASLRKYGPVVVGGDLNMQYGGARYERDLMAEHNLVPTFETLGNSFPTHDGGGHIDYVVLRQEYELSVERHFPVELNSDHKALVADLTFLRPSDAPAWTPSQAVYRPTTIRNVTDPNRVREALIISVDRVPPGAAIHLATSRIADGELKRALARAHLRGVYVQLIVHGRYKATRQEWALRRLLGTDTTRRTFAARCNSDCPAILADHGMRITSLQLSKAGRSAGVRIDSNRAASWAARKPRANAVVTTDLSTYNEGFRGFFRLVA